MSDIYRDDYRSAPVDAPPTISPRTKRVAGAVLFLVLVAAMAVWAYRLGTRDAAEIPIIRAMEVPARVQPAEPGGLEAAHQGLEVNSVIGGLPAPLPEADAPPRLALPPVTLQEEDGPQGELVVPPAAIPMITAPTAGEDLRMPVQDDGPQMGESTVADADASPQSRAGEVLGAADAAAEVAALIQSLGDEVAAESPALAAGPRPRVRPEGHAVRRPEPASPTASSPASPTAASFPAEPAHSAALPAAPAGENATTPASPREVASLQPGARLVQLGAFDSEGMARQTWNQLVSRHGDLLGAKSLFVERATHNARVFYRLRVAGFESAEQTRLLCEQLRARGVDCIPATLN